MGETSRLLMLIRTLANQGVAVVYITHRLNEVLECADRAVVLRDGERVADFSRDQLTRERLVGAMVGTIHESQRVELRSTNEKSQARLVVRGLQTQAHPKSTINLSVHKGEIVGLAGLVGAGRTEVLQSIFGVDPRVVGDVSLDGQIIAPSDPVAASRCGIAMVPEDRQRDGLMLEDSVRINASVVKIARDSIAGFIRRGAERTGVARMIDLMKIHPALPERQVALFSGGNQQKVVLAKWLSTEPSVLLLDEPSRGVDVGARAEIHALIRKAAHRGAAVLCSISDTEELLLLCDRIVVMREGRIEGEMNIADATEEAITRLAVVGGGDVASHSEAAA
jgi:ribose transport system ATP-binding protein